MGTDSATLSIALAAVDPGNPRTLYGCVEALVMPAEYEKTQLEPKRLPGMYVSRDGGDNWAMFTEKLRGFAPEGFCRLGISPSNPNLMFGQGTAGIIRSSDAGKTWSPM